MSMLMLVLMCACVCVCVCVCACVCVWACAGAAVRAAVCQRPKHVCTWNGSFTPCRWDVLRSVVWTAGTRKDAPTAQHSIYPAMTSRLHCDNTETLELSVMLLAEAVCLHTDSQEPR